MAAKSPKNLWGLGHEPICLRHLADPPKGGSRVAEIRVHGGKTAQVPKDWREHFPAGSDEADRVHRVAAGSDRVRAWVSPLVSEDSESDRRLAPSRSARVREAVGLALGQLEKSNPAFIEIDFLVPATDLAAAIEGLEIALYRYKRVLNGTKPAFGLRIAHNGKSLSAAKLAELAVGGQGVNLARHLVNLPPNLLYPASFATGVADFMAGLAGVKAEVWDEKRLEKEGLRLHLAVGRGSEHAPRLLHLRYRPAGAKGKPIALVGKGVTFDSGGLDIKPSSGMRLMKKDMGGSAAVVGALYAVAKARLKVNLDVYVGLSENAVDGRSYRPSDVIESRAGITVEIHNTDAEGRLVLADAMDVAVKQKDKPRILIDVATLTGAIKVALGSQLPGLFASDPRLADQLVKCAQAAGEPVWPMPLYQKYMAQMKSNFADLVNSVDGFGGAVTAALFLQRFTGGLPWAHFDIYAWKDSAEGAWLESGGSGQMVLALSRWLKDHGR